MRWSSLLLLLCWPGALLAEAPWQIVTDGDVQRCEPVGALAALLEDPACALDFDACAAAGPTILGEHDASALYLALIARDADGWTAACPGDGPRFLHQIGIRALGYLGAKAHVDALLALAPAAAQIGENPRRLLTEALFWIDDPKAAPALAEMLRADVVWPDYKPPAIMALARWGDARAAEWCATQLGASAPDAVAAACAHYLAQVKAKDARSLLSDALAHHPLPAARALGRLGDPEALPAIKRFAATARSNEERVAAWVTQVQLGDEGAVVRLLNALKGPAKVRTDRLESARKRAARRARRKKKPKRRRNWRRTGRSAAPKPLSRGAQKQLMNVLGALDLAHLAAMEITRIERPELKERLDRALWGAAKAEFELRWKAHTYALLALAQRGDAQAVTAVIALLGEAPEPVRRAIVAAAGGPGWDPSLPTAEYGARPIADARLQAALLALAEDCDTHAQRAAALQAALLIRQAL